MQVAIVKVGDVLMGKEAKEIKVGFFPPMNVQGGGPRHHPPRPDGAAEAGRGVLPPPHQAPHEKGVYVAMNYYDAIAKKDNPTFAKEVEAIKKSAKLIARPMDGLKSREAEHSLVPCDNDCAEDET